MDKNSRIQRFEYQSNRWYNDGLEKAKVHDFSGAIASLSRSLQYNKSNRDARNLLGLIYYGEGEVVSALVQWVISRNLNPDDNPADRFIQKVQNSQSRLESMCMAIRKYNQCLIYCEHDGVDLAIIQLKKITSSFPNYLRAQQLLALLYLQTEQYSRAKKCLKRALKIDTTNILTLRYIQELNDLAKKTPQKKEETGGVTYQMGNETIIQPVSESLRENSGQMAILNILLGVLIGAAVLGFVIIPAVRSADAKTKNDEIVAYSEQIATKESEIDDLNQQLEDAAATVENSEKSEKNSKNAIESYEHLVSAMTLRMASSDDYENIADQLLEIDADDLSENGKALYDDLKEDSFSQACASLYQNGVYYYNAGNYKKAKTDLKKVVKMDEGYDDGGALMALGRVYAKTGDTKSAVQNYNRVMELYSGTDIAEEARTAITELGDSGSSDSEDTESTEDN